MLERAVLPFVVVLVSPRRAASPRTIEVREDFCVEQFVVDATVETLRDSILPHGLPGSMYSASMTAGFRKPPLAFRGAVQLHKRSRAGLDKVNYAEQ